MRIQKFVLPLAIILSSFGAGAAPLQFGNCGPKVIEKQVQLALNKLQRGYSQLQISSIRSRGALASGQNQQIQIANKKLELNNETENPVEILTLTASDILGVSNFALLMSHEDCSVSQMIRTFNVPDSNRD